MSMLDQHGHLWRIAVGFTLLMIGTSFFLPTFKTGMAPAVGYDAFTFGLRSWRQLFAEPDRYAVLIAVSWLSNIMVPVAVWSSMHYRKHHVWFLVSSAAIAWLPLLLGPSNLLIGFYLWSGGLSSIAFLFILPYKYAQRA